MLVIPGGSRFVVFSWLYFSLVSNGGILCLQNVFDYVILRGGGYVCTQLLFVLTLCFQ